MPATLDQIARARRRVSQMEAQGLSRRTIAARAGVGGATVTRLMNSATPHVSRPVAVKLATA